MRISDWSSDVCSSDLQALLRRRAEDTPRRQREVGIAALLGTADAAAELVKLRQAEHVGTVDHHGVGGRDVEARLDDVGRQQDVVLAVVEVGHHRRSEEHTSELQSLMRISYAVFCLKKKK